MGGRDGGRDGGREGGREEERLHTTELLLQLGLILKTNDQTKI